MAFRVPTPDVSVVDLTCRLKNPVSGICVLNYFLINLVLVYFAIILPYIMILVFSYTSFFCFLIITSTLFSLLFLSTSFIHFHLSFSPSPPPISLLSPSLSSLPLPLPLLLPPLPLSPSSPSLSPRPPMILSKLHSKLPQSHPNCVVTLDILRTM